MTVLRARPSATSGVYVRLSRFENHRVNPHGGTGTNGYVGGAGLVADTGFGQALVCYPPHKTLVPPKQWTPEVVDGRLTFERCP